MQGLSQLEAKSYSGMGIVFLVFLQCQGLLVCIPSLWSFYPCAHVHCVGSSRFNRWIPEGDCLMKTFSVLNFFLIPILSYNNYVMRCSDLEK